MSHHWGGWGGSWGSGYGYYRDRYPYYYGSYYPSSSTVYVNSTNDSAQNAALAQHQQEINRIQAQNNAGDSWVSRNWVALLIAAVLIAVLIGLAMRSGNGYYHY